MENTINNMIISIIRYDIPLIHSNTKYYNDEKFIS